MIEIKFPSDRNDIALAIGRALVEIAGGDAAVTIETKTVGDVSHTIETCGVVANAPADDNITTFEDAEHHEATADVKVDEKGVPFNAEFCGVAAKPFYGSGKKKGQWKKKQGVDEDAYDEWYAGELLGAGIVDEGDNDETADDTPIETAGAFGGQTAAEEQPSGNTPKDAGELMAWVAEMQAGGHLAATAVQTAYANAGVSPADLFNPATSAKAVADVYTILSNMVSQ